MQHAVFERLPFSFRPGNVRRSSESFPRNLDNDRFRSRARFGLAREFEFEAIPERSSRAYAVWIQSSLNRILGLRLALDGIVGTLTRSAIRSFQTRSGLAADGIVGPLTEAALIRAGASHPPSGTGSSPSTNSGSSPPTSGLADPRVSVELPLEGAGFYSYDRELDADRSGRPHQFGRPETIVAVKAIGAAWRRRHPNGPRIGIGHLSLRGGGPTPGHAQHRTGLEVDVRPVRKDGREAPVTWQDSTYSRTLTRELVDLMRANRILPVYKILFNDSAIPGAQRVTGHDNHLHLWFSEPASAPVAPVAPAQRRSAGAPAPRRRAYGRASPGGTLAWGARVSPAFRSRVRQIGIELGIDPNHLMAVMAFETNETFSPSIRNQYSGATGLIQFIPSTAAKLGTSTDTLARMSAEQQLEYVAKYFRPHRGRLKTIEDVYMAVLWPLAIGKPNATALFSAPSQAYEWNKLLDSDKDGRVTKAEAAAPVRDRLSKGLEAGRRG